VPFDKSAFAKKSNMANKVFIGAIVLLAIVVIVLVVMLVK